MTDDTKLSKHMGLKISNHLNQLFPGFDKQTHEEIVAIIEGVLAEWHCTDDAKGLNALMRLNKKQGDEIERLRAALLRFVE